MMNNKVSESRHVDIARQLIKQMEAQDLSGQIIKQVIGLVQNLENSLVDLIRITGEIETRTEDSPGNAVNKGGGTRGFGV